MSQTNIARVPSESGSLKQKSASNDKFASSSPKKSAASLQLSTTSIEELIQVEENTIYEKRKSADLDLPLTIKGKLDDSQTNVLSKSQGRKGASKSNPTLLQEDSKGNSNFNTNSSRGMVQTAPLKTGGPVAVTSRARVAAPSPLANSFVAKQSGDSLATTVASSVDAIGTDSAPESEEQQQQQQQQNSLPPNFEFADEHHITPSAPHSPAPSMSRRQALSPLNPGAQIEPHVPRPKSRSANTANVIALVKLKTGEEENSAAKANKEAAKNAALQQSANALNNASTALSSENMSSGVVSPASLLSPCPTNASLNALSTETPPAMRQPQISTLPNQVIDAYNVSEKVNETSHWVNSSFHRVPAATDSVPVPETILRAASSTDETMSGPFATYQTTVFSWTRWRFENADLEFIYSTTSIQLRRKRKSTVAAAFSLAILYLIISQTSTERKTTEQQNFLAVIAVITLIVPVLYENIMCMPEANRWWLSRVYSSILPTSSMQAMDKSQYRLYVIIMDVIFPSYVMFAGLISIMTDAAQFVTNPKELLLPWLALTIYTGWRLTDRLPVISGIQNLIRYLLLLCLVILGPPTATFLGLLITKNNTVTRDYIVSIFYLVIIHIWTCWTALAWRDYTRRESFIATYRMTYVPKRVSQDALQVIQQQSPPTNISRTVSRIGSSRSGSSFQQGIVEEDENMKMQSESPPQPIPTHLLNSDDLGSSSPNILNPMKTPVSMPSLVAGKSGSKKQQNSNRKLVNALSTDGAEGANLAFTSIIKSPPPPTAKTPLERVNSLLHGLLAADIDEIQKIAIRQVLVFVNSRDGLLGNRTLEREMKKNATREDKDVKNWLVNEFTRIADKLTKSEDSFTNSFYSADSISSGANSQKSRKSTKEDVSFSPLSARRNKVKKAIGGGRARFKLDAALSNSSGFLPLTKAALMTMSQLELHALPHAVAELYSKHEPELLEMACDWSFSVRKSLPLRPMVILGFHAFRHHDLFQAFAIDAVHLVAFITAAERLYHDTNPYHNKHHAADCLQGVLALLEMNEIGSVMNDLDRLSLIFSSLIHDLDHPGVNNTFLIMTKDPLAQLYNDRSVLESHHLAKSFELLRQHDFTITLSAKQYRNFRDTVIELVLATDFASHFSVLSDFKTKYISLKQTGDHGTGESEFRLLLEKMVIKCGDVGNAARAIDVHVDWVSSIMEEFYNQGDREKLQGVPVSAFMDRDTTNIAKVEISFIDYICRPLFETLHLHAPMSIQLENMEHNKAYWVKSNATQVFMQTKSAPIVFGSEDVIAKPRDDKKTREVANSSDDASV